MALPHYFAQGQETENMVLKFFMTKGRMLVEVGALKKEGLDGKAPSIYVPNHAQSLVSPDLLTIKMEYDPTQLQATFWDFPFLWAEVKGKSEFSFYRRKNRWQSGIDDRHCNHYVEVQKLSKIPVWLFFFQPEYAPKPEREPIPSEHLPMPRGLYACPISQKWSDEGVSRGQKLVYWGLNELQKVATSEEVLAAQYEVQFCHSELLALFRSDTEQKLEQVTCQIRQILTAKENHPDRPSLLAAYTYQQKRLARKKYNEQTAKEKELIA